MLVNKKYRVRQEKDGGFLNDTESGSTFVANESALVILDFLNSQHSKEEVIAHLSNIYPDEIEQNEKEINEFIEDAIANGFLVNA